MSVAMVNLIEFSQLVTVLDTVASPKTVDRALRAAGINRRTIQAAPGYVPYYAEAIVLETVARAVGAPLLGAQLGLAFDYRSYGGYADFVLSASHLDTALTRGRRALPLLHAGSEVTLHKAEGHVCLGFRSGLETVVGHKHVDDASLFILAKVFQHFGGSNWRPTRLEVPGQKTPLLSQLEDLVQTPIVSGAEFPMIVFKEDDLHRPNPQPFSSHVTVLFKDLPDLMGVSPPRTLQDKIAEVLRLQLVSGDLSLESVAQRLQIGQRTLQRQLRTAGTSFRDVKSQFVADRALSLLLQTDLPVRDIAKSLGYFEPNSFWKAFRSWTGQNPAAFRKLAREKSLVSSQTQSHSEENQRFPVLKPE